MRHVKCGSTCTVLGRNYGGQTLSRQDSKTANRLHNLNHGVQCSLPPILHRNITAKSEPNLNDIHFTFNGDVKIGKQQILYSNTVIGTLPLVPGGL